MEEFVETSKLNTVKNLCAYCGHGNTKKCDECFEYTCPNCYSPEFEAMYPKSDVCTCNQCDDKIRAFLPKLEKINMFTNSEGKEIFYKYTNKENKYSLIPIRDFVQCALKMGRYKNGVNVE